MLLTFPADLRHLTGGRARAQISKATGKSLDLVKVVSVDTQVVAGKNYKLVLDLASPEQKVEQYEAVVYGPALSLPFSSTVSAEPLTAVLARRSLQSRWATRRCSSPASSRSTARRPRWRTRRAPSGRAARCSAHRSASARTTPRRGRRPSLRPSSCRSSPTRCCPSSCKRRAAPVQAWRAHAHLAGSGSRGAALRRQVLQAKQSVADGKVWELKLELAQGNTGAKVFDVTVSQSLGGPSHYKLEKVGQD